MKCELHSCNLSSLYAFLVLYSNAIKPSQKMQLEIKIIVKKTLNSNCKTILIQYKNISSSQIKMPCDGKYKQILESVVKSRQLLVAFKLTTASA